MHILKQVGGECYLNAQPVKEPGNDSSARANTDRKIKINSIIPSFPSEEAREHKEKEVSETLYRVFSKYL